MNTKNKHNMTISFQINYRTEWGQDLCVIETKDSYGNWHIDRNLLKDTANPLTDFTRRYISTYPDGIYGLRFVSTAPAVGDRNKGRQKK